MVEDEGGPTDEIKGPETEKYLTILHTGDIHACIQRFPRMAGAVNEIRARKESLGEPVLLTDGGDFISPIMNSWLNFMDCAPELMLMQKIGYDAVTLGNHEFDPGHYGLAPVSYTHLDVYKRQEVFQVRRCLHDDGSVFHYRPDSPMLMCRHNDINTGNITSCLLYTSRCV